MTKIDAEWFFVVVLTACMVCLSTDSFEIIAHVITENVIHKAKPYFIGDSWHAYYDQPRVPVVSTQPNNYIGVINKGDYCLRKLGTPICPSIVGFSLWMRYGGFISDILGDVKQYHDTLTQWIEQSTPKEFKWIKCFNSKDHGWSMEKFHERCDKKGPTISLFKVREDAIFGGFTTASWEGPTGEQKFADDSFLFSIKSVDNNISSRFPIITSGKAQAIYAKPDYGPCFGQNDLFIPNNPNVEGSCSSELGKTYSKSTLDETEAKTILAGSAKFGLSQMEVFYMECFHPVEFLDSAISVDNTINPVAVFEPASTRIDGNRKIIPGHYLHINLDIKHVISGFAVITNCHFTLLYEMSFGQQQTYEENDGYVKTFKPPKKVHTTFILKKALLTSWVKFQWGSSIMCVFGVTLYGCQQDCNGALGMNSGLIEDRQIKASGRKDDKHSALSSRADKNLGGGDGCWKADKGDYLQIDLNVIKIITHIGIQSCFNKDKHFPTKFALQYAGFDDIFYNFTSITQSFGRKIIYTLHKKSFGQKINKVKLVPPVVAKSIRIFPEDKTEMRVEIYGCVYTKDVEQPATVLSTGQIFYNNSRGLMLAVVKNNSGEKFLKATFHREATKMDFYNSYAIPAAQWLLVVFFNSQQFSSHEENVGVFTVNGQGKRTFILKPHGSGKQYGSRTSVIVLDHPLYNAGNVQLSDVMVLKSSKEKSPVSSGILLMRDGPFVIPSTLKEEGTSEMPFKIINSGWKSYQVCTPSDDTGPCHGVSSGSRFIYMDASAPAEMGDTAVLSTYFRVSAYRCFSFWYFMWGRNVGKLNVYIEDTSGKKELFWRLVGPQGKMWKSAKIPLSLKTAFKVIIEGVVGDGYQGDLAIDRLQLHASLCDFEPSNANPSKITGFTRSDIIGLRASYAHYLTLSLAGAGMPGRFWQPCYQASKTQDISHFWTNCGSKGPTVTIIQYNDYIFAAYNDRDWDTNYQIDMSSSFNLSSSQSFILSLSNPSSKMKLFKVNKLSRHQAIHVDRTKGPRFGKALQVEGENRKITSSLGIEYGTSYDSLYLTGLQTFTANEIEVLYAGNHPCDEWCSLHGWTCAESTGKCKCLKDRNYGWCRIGLPQSFLGAYNKSRHPHLFWDFDTYPTIYEVKTGQSITLTSEEQATVKQVDSGLSKKALRLNGAKGLRLGDYSGTCFHRDQILTTQFTFAFWLKYNDNHGSQAFFTYGSFRNGHLFQILRKHSKEAILVKAKFWNKHSSTFFHSPGNVWSHVAIVLEGSTKDPIVKVYRNGDLIDARQKLATCVPKCKTQMGSANISLGDLLNDEQTNVDASVDDIAMWCRALSKDEIRELYNFYKGPGGISIHFELDFTTKSWDDHKNQESTDFRRVQNDLIEKINAIVPSPGAKDIVFDDCRGPVTLICKVTFGTNSSNGNFVQEFSKEGVLGDGITILDSSYTNVPSTIPTVNGHNISKSEITLHWDIPENDYSIYQSHNITYHPTDDLSSIKQVIGENYITSMNLTNLTSYTSYMVHLTLRYLGDVSMQAAPITVWTAEEAPGPVQSLLLLSVTESCFTVSWENPSEPVGGRIRLFNLTYTHIRNGAKNSKVVIYQDGVTQYKNRICSLETMSPYNVSITALTVEYGKPSFVLGMTAVRGPTAPPGNVSSLNATEPHDDSSTCFVSWNPPAAETLNGNLTSYRVTYETTLTNNKTYVEIGPCKTSVVLRRLEPYKQYRVVLVATIDSGGFSPPSPPVYCFTQGTKPSAPPANSTAIVFSSTSCLVTWEQVPQPFQNGLILGYNVSYLKFGEPYYKTKHMKIEGSSTNKTEITRLEKFAFYNLTLAAYTEKGSGPHENLTCKTLEDVPDAVPSELILVSKTKVDCNISWKGVHPDKANGILLGNLITVQDTNVSDSLPSLINNTCTEQYCSGRIAALKPFRIYNITIQAFNSAGKSNGSEIQCMTDEDGPIAYPPNLTCAAISSTKIALKWDEIPELQRQGIVRKHMLHFRRVNGPLRGFILTIDNPRRNQIVGPLKEFSLYEVKVAAFTVEWSNYSEIPTKCMTLEGVPKTPPENITGNNLTAYSIRVRWDGLAVKPNGILRHWVIYYRIWNASVDTTANVLISAMHTDFVIGGLQLFTIYCVQVAGFTIGVGVRSNCTYISTDNKVLPPPDGVPAVVKEAKSSTPTKCYISWEAADNSHPDPDGQVVGYVIYYTRAGTNDTKRFIVHGKNSTSFALQSLEEFSNYQIQVAAYNIYGPGNKSVDLTCITKEDVPSTAPAKVKGFNSSSTSIRFSWEDIPSMDQNGIIREYKIIIYEVALGNSSAVVISYMPTRRDRRAISVDPHTQEITGLKKFTKYAIQVYGVTIGAGPLSPIIMVTTSEDAPTAPVTNLTVVNSSSLSLFLTWSNVPQDSHHGIIRYFVVYYWKTDWPIVVLRNVTLPINSVRKSPPGVNPEFKFNLTNLEVWTNYTVQVAGFTIRAGTATAAITLSTDESIPCEPPRVITFDVPKYSYLTVMWAEVVRSCRNGIIRGYRLTYQELPDSLPITVNFTSSVQNYTLKNMNMDANYSIKVLAFTLKGDGNSSFDVAPLDKEGPKLRPAYVLAYNYSTPTTIPVTWQPIPDPVMLEKVLGYRVAWRVVSIGGVEIEESPWQYHTVRKNSLQTTIEGLTNFAYYEVYVSGFSRGGTGPPGITSGHTCRCYKRIATNYRVFPPYNGASISKDLKKVNMSGMIPFILNNLVVDCCQSCQSHGKSYVDFVTNGHQQSAFQDNENDVVTMIDDSNDLSFPVYGWKWQNRYGDSYRFIPLVESPGFAFLLMAPETDAPMRAVLKSTFATWPYIMLTVLMALVAGIIMWFLDTVYNEEQFPHSFLRGISNGWWWAFISMTTLGYGDKVPVAKHSKVFAVIWVLTGLVVYGILSGSICTAFTSVVYESSTKLYGSKVGTVYNSPEYRFAVRRNAKIEANYSSFNEILEALKTRKVTGILMDAFEAGSKKDEFKKSGAKIRIQSVFNFQSTFGVVIAGPSTRLYQCSREWMSANRAEMINHIRKYIQVVETEEVNELLEISTGLFDPNSQVFKGFLNYCLITYGSCLGLGLLYEVWFHFRREKIGKSQASSPAYQLKLRLQELVTFTNDFIKEFRVKLINLRKKQRRELILLHRRNNRTGIGFCVIF